MNSILDIILENTYTMPDLKHRVRILKNYLEAKIFNKTSIEETIPDDSSWLASLPHDFLEQFNKNNISELFENLEQEINKITPLVIYLSLDMNEQVKSKISAWLRQNLTQKIIFETRFDPSLIGGLAFTFNGIYKDYSMRTRIEQQKELILSEFKKYV